MTTKEIALGSKVRDRISGYTGIAVGRTIYLYGCIRVEVDSTSLQEGRLVEPCVFDELQLEVLETPETTGIGTTPIKKARTSGPRPSVGRRLDFTRNH
jgi:hypothetical protein